MSNFLDLRCPKCANQNRIDILAHIWVRVTDDGTDVDGAGNHDHEFTPRSLTWCRACGHSARLAHFDPEEAQL